jgi:hypothetical protein
MAFSRRRGLQSEKSIRKRRKRFITGAVLFVVAVGSVITALVLFFRADFVTIQSIQVSGPNGAALSMVVPADVQTIVEKDLAAHLFFFFSKDSLFLYPKNAIRAELLKEFPPIASIDFSSSGSFLGFGRNISLHIVITERTPTALACTDGHASQKCFYMDASGFVYAPAPQFSPGVYIQYGLITPTPASASNSSSSPAITPGMFLTDQVDLSGAQQAVDFISRMNLDVTTVDIGNDVLGPEYQITLQAGSASVSSSTASTTGTVLYFNGNEPLDTALRYFSSFWATEAATGTPHLQYIDLRYGKDIVYKAYNNI